VKSLVLALTLAAVAANAAPALAQDDIMELLRSDLRTQVVAIVTASMELTDTEATAFWPVYREMEAEQAKLGDQRIALLKNYAAAYDSMTDATATAMVKQALDQEDNMVKLRKKYFDKMSKAVSPIVAARFLQVHGQLQNMMAVQIAEEVPLVKKPM